MFQFDLIQRTPVFITSTNLVTPVTTLSIKNMYRELVNIASFLYRFLNIFVHTFTFIFIEIIKEIELFIYNILLDVFKLKPSSLRVSNISIGKILFILTIYILPITILYILWFNQNRKINKHLHHISLLENELNYMKQLEKLREKKDVGFMSEVRSCFKGTEHKFAQLEKKLKSIEKELKIYI